MNIEQILKLFKAFVKLNRPSLDIHDVATGTGETWLRDDALERGLRDKIRNIDDILSK